VIPDKDLRIDMYTNSSPSVWMRVMHIPTGICADGEDQEGRRGRLRHTLLMRLEAKVAEAYDVEQRGGGQ